MTHRLRRILTRLRHRHFERDIAAELAHHRALKEEELARAGLSAGDARDAAARAIGNELLAREDARAVWFPAWLEAVLQDLRYGLRGLRRDRAFAAATIATLALGIGANLAIFRVLDAVLLESLPVRHAAELALIRPWAFSYPQYLELTAATRPAFSDTAARWCLVVNLSAGESVERVPAELVSGSYFRTLGVRPYLGRLLDDTDDGAEGTHRVCVVSHRLWQRVFGGDVAAIGRVVRLNGEPFQVVGVTESGFAGGDLHARSEMQVPMSMTRLFAGMPRDSAAWSWLTISARLRRGVSLQQAERVVRAHLKPAYDWQKQEPIRLEAGRQGAASLRGQLKRPALIAQLLSGSVLLVALANLAGLLLARTSSRRREFGIRHALGASRRRVASQVLTEGLLLATAAGGVGWGVAAILERVLQGMLQRPGSNVALAPSGNWLSAGALGTLVVLSALVVGVLPALAAARGERALDALQDVPAARTGRGWASGAFVPAHVALSLVLVFAGLLFARSLHNLRTVDLGFDPHHVVLMTIDPGGVRYTRERTAAFQQELLRRARLVPGVAATGLASVTSLSGGMIGGAVYVPDAPPPAGRPRNNNVNFVTAGYFESVGLPIVAGRTFSEHDASNTTRVAIVNEAFAHYYWPGQAAVGRHFALFNRQQTIEVVGVVRTAKYMEVREEPQLIIYTPLSQWPSSAVTLHARTAGDERLVMKALQAVARGIDPAVPAYGVVGLGDVVDATLSRERVLNVLSVLFAILALMVASAGLYGRVAHSVARRRREIGIRLAIGAPRQKIVTLFALGTLRLAAVGVAVGIPAALSVGRYFSAVLYGVEPASVWWASAAALLLATVSAVAVIFPAARAAGLDPTLTLREP